VMSTVGRRVCLVGFVALTFAAGACGKPAAKPGVATAAKPSVAASPSPSSNAVAQYVEGQRQWVACMRKEGYDLPDPDAQGHVNVPMEIQRNKADPRYIAAQVKCQQYLLPMPDELYPKESLSPQQVQWRRAYAKCMRENGVPTFPDPQADGSWPLHDDWQSKLTEQQTNKLFPAGQICEPLLEGRPSGSPNPHATGQG
jgi:hypothetical protein